MAQDPFKIDQLSISPGAPGTRTIGADETTGELKFWDAVAVSGIVLKALAGVAVDGLYLVGPSGVGATYANVKDALDAARSARLAATWTGPVLVLVFPGNYVENVPLTIDFDDVTVRGLGGGSISASSDDDVFKIAAYSSGGVTLWPERVKLAGLRISSASAAGKACVHVEGGDVGVVSSKVGLDGIVLEDIDWATSGSGVAIKVESANHVRVAGGSMKNCAGAGNQVVVDTCASFSVEGLADGKAFDMGYDTSHVLPEDGASSVYRFRASSLGRIAATLTGRGALEVQACDGEFDLVFAGTQKAHVLGSKIGDASVSGPSAEAVFDGTAYSSLSVGAGASAAEPVSLGFGETLPATETEAEVTIPNQPDTNYTASVSMTDFTPTTWKVTSKSTDKFVVEFTDVDAVNDRHFDWAVVRTVKTL